MVDIDLAILISKSLSERKEIVKQHLLVAERLLGEGEYIQWDKLSASGQCVRATLISKSGTIERLLEKGFYVTKNNLIKALCGVDDEE